MKQESNQKKNYKLKGSKYIMICLIEYKHKRKR